ncbi:MAG: leucine--tRNA ligase, partial [Bacteroidetes bacterium]
IKKLQVAGCQLQTGAAEKTYDELNEKEKSDVLMNYRLAYLSEAWVNWCPQMGTVLANEEVKDGVSERGGYPVERKLMPQWSLRIMAYANRLLNDLDNIEWSESIKEAQRNWIGKSEGSSLRFGVSGMEFSIEVFTTRPDTIFGVTFLTLAPESELVPQFTTSENKKAVDEYVHYAKNRSERERQSDVKKVTGQFTGAYAIHPFTGEKLPIWIGDYVLAGYGTGAVMGVPAHDMRDFSFAKHFGLQIKKVIQPNSPSPLEKGQGDEAGCFDGKEGKCINSDFLNGLEVKDALKKIISEIEKRGLGKGKTQFRLRDAIFGRQRYWGEPIPIYYENGIPKAVEEKHLPLELPQIDKYLPTENGEPPLARAKNWCYRPDVGICSPSLVERGLGGEVELTTMPGWAGSSWYYLRYMDPHNKNEFAGKDAMNYWKDVDLYIGGAEHATGHLLYVRFWAKLLYDLGLIPVVEPAKKLINQGMIQGVSSIAYCFIRASGGDSYPTNLLPRVFLSKGIAKRFSNNTPSAADIGLVDAVRKKINLQIQKTHPNSTITLDLIIPIHVDINLVKEEVMPVGEFKKLNEEYGNAEYILEEDKFYCESIVEKMSKSKLNVVTPDDICTNFGADTLRLYEMFLGPLEQSKPWSTAGITGVSGFLNKFWRLFHVETKISNIELREEFKVSEEEPTKPELKILHKTIKKIQQDIENYSFNTSVSSFMIATNDLQGLKCNKRAILEPLVILLSPFAPHIAEELWGEGKLGHKDSITYATFPVYNEAFTADDSFAYPISFNGKMRFNLELSLSLSPAEIEKEVLANPQSIKFLEGKQPQKVIVVPKRIVNIVV